MDLIIILISLIITISAQIFVKSTYNKYKKDSIKSNLSGFEVAKKILDKYGYSDIYVVETPGVLTDHFDPRRNTVRLSSEVFHGTSISAASIAAHEVGHVIQHKQGYTFIKIRSMLIPLVNFSSSASYIMILISLLTGMLDLLYLGIALLVIMLIFQLITLPVEFDASKRAKIELRKLKILNNNEIKKSKNVLTSAAITYVASVLTAILNILRLLLIARNDE